MESSISYALRAVDQLVYSRQRCALDALKYSTGLYLSRTELSDRWQVTSTAHVRAQLVRFAAAEVARLQLAPTIDSAISSIANCGLLFSADSDEALDIIADRLLFIYFKLDSAATLESDKPALLAAQSALMATIAKADDSTVARHIYSTIRWTIASKEPCVHDDISPAYAEVNERLGKLLRGII